MHHTIQAWDSSLTYTPGEIVSHNEELYEKANNDDQSEPDHVGGGWIAKSTISNSNLSEYNAIASSFDSYEQRVIDHQAKLASDRASALAKLEALGLTEDEIAALAQ